MSRRTFGQTIGAAAMGSTLQAAFFGTASAQSGDLEGPPAAGPQAKSGGDELCY